MKNIFKGNSLPLEPVYGKAGEIGGGEEGEMLERRKLEKELAFIPNGIFPSEQLPSGPGLACGQSIGIKNN